ncbi:MAG: glycoside hydrolase N-terminal domain-containing protein, partial [Thermoguttaceae bacterium]
MMRVFLSRLLRCFGALASLSCGLAAGGQAVAASPQALPRLELTAPIDRWDEAIPLGNGLMGGLLWGNGAKLRLSLDRGDLWDLRTPEPLLDKAWNYATIRKLVAEKNQARISELFDKPYNAFPYATKIPAGRLELSLADSSGAESFSLDLGTAVGQA